MPRPTDNVVPFVNPWQSITDGFQAYLIIMTILVILKLLKHMTKK